MAISVRLDTAEPLVSICIPVYNGEKFLRRTIASALKQTYTNIEILIIDDGSDDNSWKLIGEFDDLRITATRNATNLGPEGNWNKVLSEASGKYVKLLHQDDLLAEHCIAEQVRGLESHPGAVLAFCRRRIIGVRDQQYCFRGPRIKTGLIDGRALVKSCITGGNNLIGEPAAVLFRRSTAQVVGYFSARFPYVIDLDYWVRLLQHGHAFFTAEALASYRVSPQQWSVAVRGSQASDFVQLLSTHTALAQYRGSAFLMLQAKCGVYARQLLRVLFYMLFLRSTPGT